MLTPKRPPSRTIGSVRASFSKQTSARSGSSDSEHKAFAVMPPAPAGPAPVITATPVANRPKTSRNSSGSIGEIMVNFYTGSRVRVPRASPGGARSGPRPGPEPGRATDQEGEDPGADLWLPPSEDDRAGVGARTSPADAGDATSLSVPLDLLLPDGSP